MSRDDIDLRQMVVDLYGKGLSTYRIGDLLGIGRQRASRILRQAGVPVALKGRGRSRPAQRLRDPPELPELLKDLYRDLGLSAREVGAKLGMSERTVRNRLAELGIEARTKGGWNREDRRVLNPAEVEKLYVERRETAEKVGTALDASRRLVLRALHERGIPVRSGGALDEATITLVRALYTDRDVLSVLVRRGVPVVPPFGPISTRFPSPVSLTRELVSELYVDCGVALTHIELLTGQPEATVRRRLVTWGIPVRNPGGRSPFLSRLIARQREVRGPGSESRARE
ncbi:MAG: hypothetical protein ACRDXC_12550, partial [Acidimicrobiales bacterium]